MRILNDRAPANMAHWRCIARIGRARKMERRETTDDELDLRKRYEYVGIYSPTTCSPTAHQPLEAPATPHRKCQRTRNVGRCMSWIWVLKANWPPSPNSCNTRHSSFESVAVRSNLGTATSRSHIMVRRHAGRNSTQNASNAHSSATIRHSRRR